MDKEKILKELAEVFEETKNELGFTPTFEELETAFEFKNAVLNRGFVPLDFYRVLCSSIAQDYRDWQVFLNNLLIPNSSSYTSQIEAKLFSSVKDKKMLWELIKKAMEFSSMSAVVTIRNDKELAAIFIDKAYSYWITEFNPKMTEIIVKINEAWKE